MDLEAVASSHTFVDARTLGGITTVLVAGLLSLLYVYRRRTYILCWVSGWTLTALSLLIAAHDFALEDADVRRQDDGEGGQLAQPLRGEKRADFHGSTMPHEA